MKQPTLPFWQGWNLSFGFLGVQFGFALQNETATKLSLGKRHGIFWQLFINMPGTMRQLAFVQFFSWLLDVKLLLTR